MQMQPPDLGGLSPVQAKGELSRELVRLAFLAVLPSMGSPWRWGQDWGPAWRRHGPGSTYSTLQFSCYCPSGGPDSALCSGYLPLFCLRSGSRVSFTARPPTKGLRRPQRGSLSGRRQQSLRRALWAVPHPLFPCRGKGRPEASQGWGAVGLERWGEQGAGLQPKQQQRRFLVSAS